MQTGEIAAAIEARLVEIEADIDASPLGVERAGLRSALAALTPPATKPPPRASRARRKPSARKSTVRGRAATRSQVLLAAVRDHPGSTLPRLGVVLNWERNQTNAMYGVAKRLVAAGELTPAGTKPESYTVPEST